MLDDFRSLKDSGNHEGFGEQKQTMTQKKIGLALSFAAIFLGLFLLISPSDSSQDTTNNKVSSSKNKHESDQEEDIEQLKAQIASLEAKLAGRQGAFLAFADESEKDESAKPIQSNLEIDSSKSDQPQEPAKAEYSSDALKKLIAKELQQELGESTPISGSDMQPQPSQAPTPPPQIEEKPVLPIKSQPKANSKPTPKQQPTTSSSKSYTVQRGDTLSTISQKVYGTSKRWREIAQANKDKITADNQVRVGTTLSIP